MGRTARCIIGSVEARIWTAQKLRDLAAANGHTWLTLRQIERWRKAGLLPRPARRSLGRGRGMESTYPDGADKQLLAVCSLRAKRQSLSSLGWSLWLRGFPVPLDVIRDSIKKSCGMVQLLRRQFQKNPAWIDDQVHAPSISRTRFYKFVRRRVRNDARAENFVSLLGRVLLGLPVSGSGIRERHEDAKLLNTGLGLNEEKNEGPTQSWYPGDILHDLEGVEAILAKLVDSEGAPSDWAIDQAAPGLDAFRKFPDMLDTIKRTGGLSLQGHGSLMLLGSSLDNSFVGPMVLAMLIYFHENHPDRLNEVITSISGLAEVLKNAEQRRAAEAPAL